LYVDVKVDLSHGGKNIGIREYGDEEGIWA